MRGEAQRCCKPIRQFVEAKSSADSHSAEYRRSDVVRQLEPSVLTDALVRAAQSEKHNGYTATVGCLPARQAVAERYSFPSRHCPHLTSGNSFARTLQPQHIVLGSGASATLALAMEAFANSSHDSEDCILLPSPLFPLYLTIASHSGIRVKFYNLLPERNWEIDLKHLESLIDTNTRCVLINNPSNPSGSNFSRQHLLDLLSVCEKHHLPIISDEIYDGIVFDRELFWPIAALTRTVPVITIGGLSKQFVCPGLRMGWLLVYDLPDTPVLTQVVKGIVNLSQLSVGCCHAIQAVLPDVLLKLDANYIEDTNKALGAQSRYVADRLASVLGLKCIRAQGAMYSMLQILPELLNGDDEQFAQQLLNEFNVFCLPGQCFRAPGFVRIVTVAPVAILKDACDRIHKLCLTHTVKHN